LNAAGLRGDDDEDRVAAADRREHEAAAGRIPGARRVDELEAVEVRVGRTLEKLALGPPRFRAGEEDLDREQVLLGHERNLAAVRAERRADVHAAARVAADERPQMHARLHRFGRFGVAGAQPAVPLLGEARHADVEHLLDLPCEVAGLRVQHPRHGGGAVTFGDELPQRVTITVREVPGVLEFLDGGEPARAHGVAHPHRGLVGRIGDGVVLRHPLDEPERHRRDRRMAGPREVVLEGVNELVADHVIRLAQAHAEGERHPVALPLRDASDAVAERVGDDVGLDEVAVARVEDERLAPLQLMTEKRREPRIPALGEHPRLPSRLLLGRVVVDVEMRRFENPEIELPVAYLVLAEVLCVRAPWRSQPAERETHNESESSSRSCAHVPPRGRLAQNAGPRGSRRDVEISACEDGRGQPARAWRAD
jgi:hypothetical protein